MLDVASSSGLAMRGPVVWPRRVTAVSIEITAPRVSAVVRELTVSWIIGMTVPSEKAKPRLATMSTATEPARPITR